MTPLASHALVGTLLAGCWYAAFHGPRLLRRLIQWANSGWTCADCGTVGHTAPASPDESRLLCNDCASGRTEIEALERIWKLPAGAGR